MIQNSYKKEQLQIGLCGSPEFVCPFFEEAKKHFKINFVITQAAKPKNRGQKTEPSSVAQWAHKNNIKCFEIDKIIRFDDDILLLEKSLKEVECVLLFAFGKIIPASWLDMPKFGWLNIHPSRLPALRGASPLQYAILQGLETSALTLMKMDAGMDTGDIVAQKDFSINKHDTTASLLNQLSIWGPSWVINNMYDYMRGKIQPIKQHGEATYSRLIKKSDYILNLEETSEDVRSKTRAFGYIYSPMHDIKIFACEVNSDKEFQIKLNQGNISPIYVQRPGRKMMHIRNFLNGFKK